MTNRSFSPKDPAKGDLQQTPEEGRIESPLNSKVSEPANLEKATPSHEPVKVDAKQESTRIQTDVREKLAKKSTDDNVFVPSNPAALEKAAEQIAQDSGFELTRGTSIGARLLARAQQKFK